jgi:hypothetical protein
LGEANNVSALFNICEVPGKDSITGSMTVGEPVDVRESVDAGESRNLLKQTKIIKQ